jgi:hypothetical protein
MHILTANIHTEKNKDQNAWTPTHKKPYKHKQIRMQALPHTQTTNHTDRNKQECRHFHTHKQQTVQTQTIKNAGTSTHTNNKPYRHK